MIYKPETAATMHRHQHFYFHNDGTHNVASPIHGYPTPTSNMYYGRPFHYDYPSHYQGSCDVEFRYSQPYHAAENIVVDESLISPHENDVLMGRGGKNNRHSGNEKLREIARGYCSKYRISSKKGKSSISREIVQQMRELQPSARFLKRDSETGAWVDVGDDVAREKASQVLRDAVALLHDDKESEPSGKSSKSLSSRSADYQDSRTDTQHYSTYSQQEGKDPDIQKSSHDGVDSACGVAGSQFDSRFWGAYAGSASFPPSLPPDSSRKRHRSEYEGDYWPPHSQGTKWIPPQSDEDGDRLRSPRRRRRSEPHVSLSPEAFNVPRDPLYANSSPVDQIESVDNRNCRIAQTTQLERPNVSRGSELTLLHQKHRQSFLPPAPATLSYHSMSRQYHPGSPQVSSLPKPYPLVHDGQAQNPDGKHISRPPSIAVAGTSEGRQASITSCGSILNEMGLNEFDLFNEELFDGIDDAKNPVAGTSLAVSPR